MKANEIQVGGSHYKHGDHEEHWDRAWRLRYDPFQYIITKWIERWRDKGGIEDLKKVQHAIQKYIELVEAGGDLTATQPWWNPADEDRKLFGPRSAGGGGSTGSGKVETVTFDPSGHFAAAVEERVNAHQLANEPWTSHPAQAAERGGAVPLPVTPEDFMKSAAVKQTGYVGFTYEGGTAEWDLFTCKRCRKEVRVHVNEAPGKFHTCELEGI